MRDSKAKRIPRSPLVLVAALCALAALPLLSSARARSNSINVVNSSGRQIVHIYLSPAESDNWGPEQLNGSVIAPGQSFNVEDVACSQSQIKVVAEDGEGCFLSSPVSCGGATTWTITNETAADCGL
jgi:hypothetical protein